MIKECTIEKPARKEVAQENIKLDNKILIELAYNNKKYYPLTHTFENVLLKSKRGASVLIKNGYKDIVKLEVNYNFKAEMRQSNHGGVHKAQCISKDCLIKLLKDSKIGGFNEDQKKAMNNLLEYLGQKLIDKKPRFVDNYDFENSAVYNEFEKDCIRETCELHDINQWQKCTICNKYYPLHSNFFSYNKRDGIMGTVCHNCNNRKSFIHPDEYLNSIYNRYGEEIYFYYKKHDVISLYNCYMQNKLKTIPEIIKNKDDYLAIIKYLYNKNKINKNNLNFGLLINTHKLTSVRELLSQDEIFYHLFNENPREYPWHYAKYQIKLDTSLEESINRFNNYIKEKNIIIENIYNFDYYSIAIKSKVNKRYCRDILKFVMKYYDNKYPAYKFNIASVNYWRNKKHRHMALKYLVKQDMKLEIKDIPLYLTITSIRNVAGNTMINVLRKYYNNLYEWVNEVYPAIFTPIDFNIHYIKDQFDSVDEGLVHNILKQNFDNVIYNSRNTNSTIKFMDKVPDWIILTNNGCLIVEYFGMWSKSSSHNSRTKDYMIRSNDKMEKYKRLNGYEFLYIFPDDLRNNYEGLFNKISKYLI